MNDEKVAGDDMRADFAAAIKTVAAGEPDDAGAPEPPPLAEPPPEAEPDQAAEEPKEKIASRGPDGKFAAAPKAAEKPGVLPPAPLGKADATAAPPVGAPALKPPQSWKPAAREKWDTLTPDMQQEAVRVEREAQSAIRQAADARQFREGFERSILAPHQALFSARGVQPAQLISDLVARESRFQFAPPAQKAAMLAEVFKASGATLEQLAAAIDGQPTAQPQSFDPHALAAQVEKAVLAKVSAQQQESVRAQVGPEVAKFEESAEFIGDLRDEVADRLESAARRGLTLGLQEAYDQACWSDARIRGILQQREASKKAATGDSATQRARAAASSVRSHPGGASQARPREGLSDREDLQEDLKASISELRRR